MSEENLSFNDPIVAASADHNSSDIRTPTLSHSPGDLKPSQNLTPSPSHQTQLEAQAPQPKQPTSEKFDKDVCVELASEWPERDANPTRMGKKKLFESLKNFYKIQC